MIPGPPNNGAEPPTPADATAPTSTPCVLVKPARRKRELTLIPHQRPDQMTPERGRCRPLIGVARHALVVDHLSVRHANNRSRGIAPVYARKMGADSCEG